MNKPNFPAFGSDVRDQTWATRRLGEHLLLSQADIERLNAMHPRCAKCGKLVDTLSWHCDPVRPYEIIFEASCHGETEKTRINFNDLPALMLNGVQGAEAFRELTKISNT